MHKNALYAYTKEGLFITAGSVFFIILGENCQNTYMSEFPFPLSPSIAGNSKIRIYYLN
ncbi:hypothetical protein RhiirC2_758949, partial [Rhizophagus irregularis]